MADDIIDDLRLFDECDDAHLAAAFRTEQKVNFMEGLTVYSIEKLYPGIFRSGLIEKNVPLNMKNFIPYTKEFLKDLQHFNYRVYQRYFIDASQDPVIPAKFGYWHGYTVVKSLVKEHSIQQMINWTPDEGVDVMREEIDEIIKQN